MTMRFATLYPDLSDEDVEYLRSCARIRKCSMTYLLNAIVQMIARDQMVLMVLDDESKPPQRSQRDRPPDRSIRLIGPPLVGKMKLKPRGVQATLESS